MKKHLATVVIIVLAAYACFATLAAGLFRLESQSREELLKKLAMAKPGVRISAISRQLGRPMGEYSNTDEMLAWGTVKDRSFCQDKKLLRFYASTPPCRALDVYADANGVVVYATWTGL